MSLRHPAALFATLLLSGSLPFTAEAAEPSAPEFWQFVTQMRVAVPGGVSEVDAHLPVAVELVNETDTVNSYQTASFALRQGSVDYLEYRVAKAFPLAVKRLAFDIDRICVRQHTVRKNYPGVKLTDTPRGGAIHEQTYYAVTDELGTIGFGFPEHRRYCLQSVVILPPGRTTIRK
jgi:isocitrate/isopropylmalate dehydrogenase